MAGFRSFDRVAASYESLERLTFGGALQAARTAQLGHIPPPRRALLLGEGDGRFAEALLMRFPEATVQIVDRSAKMLERARRRTERFAGRVELLEADARSCRLAGPFDLVTTLFFLDCFEARDQATLIPRVAATLEPHATWLHADFAPGRSGWRGVRNRAWLWLLYRAFGSVTDISAQRLCDPLPTLARAGFEMAHESTFRRGLLASYALRRSGSGRGSGLWRDRPGGRVPSDPFEPQ